MILNYFHELNKLNETWELEEVFETHDELNQQLFDNDVLRKDIRERLLEIVDLFVSKIKEDNIPINVIDYWLLGSNAAYNYGPKSDIDIHIIVNLEDLGVDPYILQVLYDYIKSDFNNKYDIEVKGHEVELYLEDVRSGAVTNGIYSLKQNRWIKFPTRTEYMRFDVTETDEYKDWYQRYLTLEDNEIEQFINDLYLMRKESLATEGEWGPGNLIFKEFRNLGYLDSLKDRKYKYKSKELTLESLNESSLVENWYEITALNSSLKPFYFYSSSYNNAIKTLTSIIQGNSEPKQQYNRILLDEIRGQYKNKLKKNPNFSAYFNILSINPKRVKDDRNLTLTDRALRQDTHDLINSKSNFKNDINSSEVDNKDYYVHHKDGQEKNNNFDNLVLIDNSNDIKFAHAIHKIIQDNPKITTPHIKIPIYEFDIKTKKWINSHTAEFEIS